MSLGRLCLKSQLEALKSSVVQLKETIATLESEKASLITSLRLIQQTPNEVIPASQQATVTQPVTHQETEENKKKKKTTRK